jgi:hypothetical protein
MSIKTLANRATSAFGKKLLTVQHHSPTVLVAAGVVGVGASVVLACRATLKLSETLAEGEEHLKKVEVTVKEDGDEKKTSFNIRVQTAIKIARLYAPSAILLGASLGAIVGSNIILRRRNAAITAAYAIVHKGFEDYRGRVRAELGEEKDLEFRFGVTEREIVEEGPDGPEVKIVRGLDQEAIQKEVLAGRTYARIFAPQHADGTENDNWSDLPHNNQYFVKMVLQHSRDALTRNGHLFLSDVYDMLGFPRTLASTQVGWVSKPQYDENGKQTNDTYVDFGLWDQGMHAGKEWVNGHPKAFLLDFNVDGVITQVLETM